MKIKGCLPVLVASVIAVASHSAAAEGDVAKGEKLFKRCAACHSLEAGKKKIGPSLAGVFGRKAGTVEGFKYSKAMMASDIVWDEETIDQYLEKPKTFIPKNKMAFPGFKKPEQRADVIAYLKEATAQ
jgi:cytochrome c